MSPLLWTLAAANFVIGMGAFVAIGLLSQIGATYRLEAADAAWVMTTYALVYCLSSPVLVSMTGGHARDRVLLVGMAIFLIGTTLTALAPGFDALLGARAITAIGAGLVTPVAASIGVATSRPDRRGHALAVVFGGLTLAQALGVPVGTWLGYAAGWRAAFWVVAVLALISMALLVRLLPARLSLPATSIATLAQVLASFRLVAAVAFTALFTGGVYVVFTFLSRLLEAELGLGRDGISALLLVFGAGAVLGNAVGGALTDRVGAVRTLSLLCVAQILVMPVLTFVGLPVVAAGALILVWSVFAWAFMVPQQARLAGLDPQRTAVLFALNAAAIYLGGAIGSLVGGQVVRGLGFPLLGMAGAVLVAMALASLALVKRLPPGKRI